jgi:hypothetical protein
MGKAMTDPASRPSDLDLECEAIEEGLVEFEAIYHRVFRPRGVEYQHALTTYLLARIDASLDAVLDALSTPDRDEPWRDGA